MNMIVPLHLSDSVRSELILKQNSSLRLLLALSTPSILTPFWFGGYLVRGDIVYN